jgi:hypothetical protein
VGDDRDAIDASAELIMETEDSSFAADQVYYDHDVSTQMFNEISDTGCPLLSSQSQDQFYQHQAVLPAWTQEPSVNQDLINLLRSSCKFLPSVVNEGNSDGNKWH